MRKGWFCGQCGALAWLWLNMIKPLVQLLFQLLNLLFFSLYEKLIFVPRIPHHSMLILSFRKLTSNRTCKKKTQLSSYHAVEVGQLGRLSLTKCVPGNSASFHVPLFLGWWIHVLLVTNETLIKFGTVNHEWSLGASGLFRGHYTTNPNNVLRGSPSK